MNRPRWRWALFCIALWLNFKTAWKWPGELLSWCVLPEWLASPDDLSAHAKNPESPW